MGTGTRVDAPAVDGGLGRLFRPRSVALVGASKDASKLASKPLEYLDRYGFAGAVYPVNPKYDRLGARDRHCYPALEDLPEVPDVALVMLPYEAAARALRDCGRLGVPFVVMVSGQAQGARSDPVAEAVADLRAAGRPTRLLGPNTNGIIATDSLLTLGWQPALELEMPLSGGVSIVSQSGSMVSSVIERMRTVGIGVNRVVSTGSELDLQLGDVVTDLAGDDETSVIAVFLEALRDAGSFTRAAALARESGTPLVVLKVGRSDAARAAAGAHTGALVGEGRVYSEAFRRTGAIEVASLEDLASVVRLLSNPRRPTAPTAAIFSISGGMCALLADEASDAGVGVPAPGPAAADIIARRLKMVAPLNPCDLTGEVSDNPSLLTDVLQGLATGADVGSFVFGLGLVPRHVSLALSEHYARYAAEEDRLCVAVAPAGRLYDDDEALLERAGVPVFPNSPTLLRAIAAVAAWHAGTGRVSPDPARGPAADPLPDRTDEHRLKGYLAAQGVPTPAGRLVASADDAVAAATDVGYPVVVKGLVPGELHKSDRGLVRLGLSSPEAVRGGYAAVQAALGPDTDALVLVEAMRPGAHELIVAARRDPVFGPLVVVGLGGVYAELLGDTAIRFAPLTPQDGVEMLQSLRAWPVLAGYRNAPGIAVEAVADALVRVGAIAQALPGGVRTLEINPLAVTAAGDVYALDAVVERDPDPGAD